jgi:hypothetical protein
VGCELARDFVGEVSGGNTDDEFWFSQGRGFGHASTTGDVFGELLDGLENLFPAAGCQPFGVTGFFDEGESRNHYGAVDLLFRLSGEEVLEECSGFRGIGGEETLVKALGRWKSCLIAKEYVEIWQLWDLTADNNEAHRERRGQQEARESPEKRPEDGGNEHSNGRKAG